MSITRVNRYTGTGTSGNAPTCTVSGATAGNFLVAVCEVREELSPITLLTVSSFSISAGWSSGSNAPRGQFVAIAITSKVAEGTTDDNITFSVSGPTSVYGWSVIVYEFDFEPTGVSTAQSLDAVPDTTWTLPTDDWVDSNKPSGLAVIFGIYQIGDTGNTSSAYNRTDNPNNFTWDETWDNYERTTYYSSTYYSKFSLGWKEVVNPSSSNEPTSSMTFAGANVDTTLTLWATGGVFIAGGMLGCSF
jgi:hypothetical protein